MKRFFRVLLFAMLLKGGLKCRETLIKTQHFHESGRGVHSRGSILFTTVNSFNRRLSVVHVIVSVYYAAHGFPTRD